MKKVSTAKIISFVLLALMGCHIAYYWQHLPDEMVTHFDANWNPNGWMSKGVFVLTYLGMVGLVALSFLGSLSILGKIPHRWINLPQKDYWLGPDRKDYTLGYISDVTIRMHNVTQTFIFAMMHMIIRFNITGEDIDSGTFWVLFSVYMAYMVLWTIMFYVKFARKPADMSAGMGMQAGS